MTKSMKNFPELKNDFMPTSHELARILFSRIKVNLLSSASVLRIAENPLLRFLFT